MNSLRRKSRPLIKICGQTHITATTNAIACGAQFVGFIFHPDSPRSITAERAKKISTGLTQRVGVFVMQEGEEICHIMQEARLHFAQLHGKQSTRDAQIIGKERVIRVLWPEKHESVESLQAEIDAWAPYCSYYLLDAGKGGGGHGRTLEVEQLNKLHFNHPWFLAGGLSPENLASLLSKCKPDGIDLNSGLEIAPGLKVVARLLAATRCLDSFSTSI